jgi:hypothetical protein
MLHLGAISCATNSDYVSLFRGRQEAQLKHKDMGLTSSMMTTSAQRPTIDTRTTIRLVKELALGLKRTGYTASHVSRIDRGALRSKEQSIFQPDYHRYAGNREAEESMSSLV